MRNFFRIAGLMMTTTVGAGLFALPYVTYRAGLAAGIGYLVLLGVVVAFVHSLYFRALESRRNGEGLVGLVRETLGEEWRIFSYVVILGGLTLALLVYLILAGQFVELLFPGFGAWGIGIFWVAGSLPILFRLRRMIAAELFGCVVMVAAVLVIFFGAFGDAVPRSFPAMDISFFFLPFGAALFALTGWTAVEPIAAYSRSAGVPDLGARRAMGWGTALSVLFYFLFIVGVLVSAQEITPDTMSGVLNWPLWKFGFLIALGLFAIWTSYVPIGVEIERALHHDLRAPRLVAQTFVFAAPLALYALGFRNFLDALGLAGSVFLGLEYVLILFAAKKALRLSPAARFLSLCLIALFLFAAVYELYSFV